MIFTRPQSWYRILTSIVCFAVVLLPIACVRAPKPAPAAPPKTASASAPATASQFKPAPAAQAENGMLPHVALFDAALPDGLHYYLMPSRELPMVKVQLWLNAGERCEPENLAGLGSVLAETLVSGGTERRDPETVTEWIEDHGARIQVKNGFDQLYLSASLLKEDLTAGMELLAEIVQSPRFDERLVAVAKQKLHSAIDRRGEDVDELAWKLFFRLLYGAHHPLGRMAFHETVEAIKPESLRQFHETWFAPDRMRLGLLGDFDPEAVKPLLESCWGGWRHPAKNELPSVAQPAAGVKPGIYVLEREDLEQCTFIMGHAGINKKDPDYYRAVLLDYMVGAGWSSRLANEIREKRGLAYTVYGGFWTEFIRPGEFKVFCKTKNATAVKSMQLVESELKRLRSEGVKDEELNEHKESYKNNFVFNFKDNQSILGMTAALDSYGYPRDFLEQEYQHVTAVTAADILPAAQRLIHPEQFVIMVIGNSKHLDAPLSSIAAVHTIDPETLTVLEK